MPEPKKMIIINKKLVRITLFNGLSYYVLITLTMKYDFFTRSQRVLFVFSTYHLCIIHIYHEIEKIQNLDRSRSSSDGDQTRRIHTMGTVW